MAGEEHEPAQVVTPFALALVVCDAIWQDPSTRKVTILGCFSTISAGVFPAKHPIMSVYAVVTDGRGSVPLVLRLVDVDDNDPPLFEQKGEAKFTDPRMVVEIFFTALNVIFPRAGEYRLQLMSGSTSLLERRILVIQAGAKNDSQIEPRHD